MQLCRFNYFVT